MEFDVLPGYGGDQGGDGADCGLHGVVNGSCVLVEDACELFAELDLRGCELASIACSFGIYFFVCIYGWCMGGASVVASWVMDA